MGGPHERICQECRKAGEVYWKITQPARALYVRATNRAYIRVGHVFTRCGHMVIEDYKPIEAYPGAIVHA